MASSSDEHIDIEHHHHQVHNEAPQEDSKINTKFIEEVGMGIFFSVALVAIVILLVIFGSGNNTPPKLFTFKDMFNSTYSGDGASAQWVGGQILSSVRNNNGTREIIGYNVSTVDLDIISYLNESTLVNDLNRTVWFYSYSFSYDSNYILLAVDAVPIWRHSFYANYLIYDVNTQKVTWLGGFNDSTNPGLLNAQWSPSNYQIAFVDINYNIFIQNATSTDTVKVTSDGQKNQIINGIFDWVYEEEVWSDYNALWWSPDGKNLAYLKSNEQYISTFSFPHYEDILLSPYLDTINIKYPKSGTNNPLVTVCVYEVQTNQTTYMESQNQTLYLTDAIWQSESTLFYKTTNRHQDAEYATFYNVTSKSNTTYTLQQLDKPGWIEARTQSILFHPSGEMIAIRNNSGYYHLAIIETNGNNFTVRKFLTSGKWDVMKIAGYNDTAIFYLSSEVSAVELRLYGVALNNVNYTHEILTPIEGNYDVLFNQDGSHYVLYYQGPNIPTISLHRQDTRELVKSLQDNARLKAVLKDMTLPTKTFIQIPINNTYGNTTLNAWIMMPPTSTSTSVHGLVLNIYCGPYSQTVTKTWSLGFNEYMASNLGLIVASVDTRGTGARGIDFSQQTYLNLGEIEALDLNSTVTYLVNTNSQIDGLRTSIFGWSYGGYMALKSLEINNPVFKTTVSVAPVTDWRLYDTFYTERFMRTPEENLDGYNKTSVILNAKNLKKRFLLIHGTGDDNVHFQNTVELNKQLISLGIQYDTMFYANRDHGIGGNGAREHLYTLIGTYLNNTVGSNSK